MSETAPTRRRFRFSLRTLLVLVVILAIPLGWIAKERRQSQREQEIAEQLRNQGNHSVVLGGPYDKLHLADTQGWWRNLARTVLGARIEVIGAHGPGLQDLSPLAGLTNLECLEIPFTQVSDLKPIAGLTTLQNVSLSNTHVSDLTPLVGLKHLQILRIDRTRVSDLTPLASIITLRYVSIDGTQVSDFRPLASLKYLQRLDLMNMEVSGKQIAALQQALPDCIINSSPIVAPK